MKKLLLNIRDYSILIAKNILLRPFLTKDRRNCKYKISICAIFKNEAPFLREWIEYHSMIGVEHFYLYNNNSTDDYLDVLKPYIDQGLVSLTLWNYDQAQMAAYKDFYIKHGQESNWVSFLDVDEFINPQKKENLCEWLSHMDKYPSILIYFKMFGTSGKMHHDYNKLVTEQYLVAWSGLFKVGKCLINTRYDIARYDATTHHCPQLIFPILWTKIKVRPANCFRLFVDWTHHFSALYNDDKATIQINHYWSKAWDVYDKKRKMTDVYFKKNPKENIGYFYKNEECNNSCDFSIFRRVMRLKFKMNIKD